MVKCIGELVQFRSKVVRLGSNLCRRLGGGLQQHMGQGKLHVGRIKIYSTTSAESWHESAYH